MKKIFLSLASMVVIFALFLSGRGEEFVLIVVQALNIVDVDVWLKILPIPISVLLALTVVTRNHNFAVAREDRKLQVEKVEALYMAVVEYHSAAESILNWHKSNLKQPKMQFADEYGRYPHNDLSTSSFDLALDKLDMLFGLYFEDEGIDSDNYKIPALHLPYLRPEDVVELKYVIGEKKDKLISICRKIKSENELQTSSKPNPAKKVLG